MSEPVITVDTQTPPRPGERYVPFGPEKIPEEDWPDFVVRPNEIHWYRVTVWEQGDNGPRRIIWRTRARNSMAAIIIVANALTMIATTLMIGNSEELEEERLVGDDIASAIVFTLGRMGIQCVEYPRNTGPEIVDCAYLIEGIYGAEVQLDD